MACRVTENMKRNLRALITNSRIKYVSNLKKQMTKFRKQSKHFPLILTALCIVTMATRQ